MSTRSMRAVARRAAAPAVVVLALSACGLFPKEKVVQEPILPEPPSVSSAITFPVTRGDIADMVQGTAELTPVREVVLYFKEAGRVKEITATPNKRVSAGEVLARLDIGDLEHQLRLATIDQQIAELTLERMNALAADSYDRRIQELVVARARENVDYLRGRADASTIRAPFAGVVKSVEAEVSERVQDYATVITLSDPSALELQMKVTRDEGFGISMGLPAEVTIDDRNWLPTKVTQSTHRDPSRDASVTVEEFIVHLALPRLMPDVDLGSLVGARIILRRRKNTLLIPLAGLREFGGRTYVRVMEGESRHEQDVRVGIRTETEVEIISGLTEGQLVIGR